LNAPRAHTATSPARTAACRVGPGAFGCTFAF
jgi:hypothetical protein